MVGLEVPAPDGRERGRRAGDIHAVNVSVRSVDRLFRASWLSSLKAEE